ncbi:actin-related protein 6 [Chrysoperla carnea]|uniref:actin-related protein 6 n=1 Tax=Chrysoperla carnea TaxID=189513 RepID=UPI001D08D657|nr:actin-related protein 6 [Chrysoperla carnea]XP_044735336.1 actin-related protein 6 [Chrysoperla carnea]
MVQPKRNKNTSSSSSNPSPITPRGNKRNTRSESTSSITTTGGTPTLILDNGGYTAKCGYSHQPKIPPMIIPNCIMKVKSERRRAFIGNQIDECTDASGLYYILPFQRGYLINWDTQKTVWDYIFSDECLSVNFNEVPVIITEPIFNFRSIQEGITEIFFEEYECPALLRCNATDLSHFNYSQTNDNHLGCLVVDSGFSFTHIVPYINGVKVRSAIRRIDVGGKVLTNQLKEIISYRQLNVMDETHVMNQCKEDCCYVSLDFKSDLEKTRLRGKANDILKEYVLPDYNVVKRGYIQDSNNDNMNSYETQNLIMNNERITIPEILFHPQDIGLEQKGIAEAVLESIYACPEETHSVLFKNIVVTGGSTKFKNFAERLEKDVRAMTSSYYDVQVTSPKDPITYAYEGGIAQSADPDFYAKCVTKEEYMEEGFQVALERFDI